MKELIISIKSVGALTLGIVGSVCVVAGAQGIYNGLEWDGFATRCAVIAFVGSAAICGAVVLGFSAYADFKELNERLEQDRRELEE